MTTRTRSARLSPREEVTLRRVALGYAGRGELPASELARLVQLGLVADIDGVLSLTTAGRRRYEQQTRPAGPIGDAMPDDLQRLLGMLVARPPR